VGEGSPLPLRAGGTASQRLTRRDERGWGGGGEQARGGRRESGGGVRVRAAAPPRGGGGVLIGRWGGGCVRKMARGLAEKQLLIDFPFFL
jgi:hypothetical protein